MTSLWSSVSIGQVQFRNRIVMPPMVRIVPSMPREVVGTDGSVTGAVLEHYRSRAAAGTSMINVEVTAVDPRGRVCTTIGGRSESSKGNGLRQRLLRGRAERQ